MIIEAALVGGGVVPRVQVVVDQVTAGVPYTVTGSLAGGFSWPVPGGSGVGDGGAVVLVDNRTPVNLPVTYTVQADSMAVSAPVTVRVPGDVVIQSLTSSLTVVGEIRPGLADVTIPNRTAAFEVAGRSTRVFRTGVGGAARSVLSIRLEEPQYPNLEDVLRGGDLVALRLGAHVPGMDESMVVAITGDAQARSFMHGAAPHRYWDIPIERSDDPYVLVALSAFSWSEWDATLTGYTWADFDALMSGRTWGEFDAMDWSQVPPHA